ncbi:hypothetical protein [Nitrospina watsonii]|uniref:Uncharacterized protein n=1 Tax=Nitrospina watsonii TaxID=1323948 RepID=A0ABM9HI26_9BACT|nr:hypothetical protein [Nitrospina watsonii]CAI2719711.1 conserved protein of unknown function [Nitrospina watsonii]
MSLLERDNINYLTHVEQFFLTLKGSGLSLSASDYDLITQWESRQVPVQLLCRAIESAFRRAEDQARGPLAKVSLTGLREQVETEIERAAR